MTIISSIVIFIIGAIAGFVINKFFGASSQDQQQLSDKINKGEAELAQYKLDVAEHLDSSAKLLEQMNSTCQVAMKQMAQSTELLQQATTTDSGTMPFFSHSTANSFFSER